MAAVVGHGMTLTDPNASRENVIQAVSSDPIHDFTWHRHHRSRRKIRLVDLAMITAWGTFIGWILFHH
jgi:hypothetical protein